MKSTKTVTCANTYKVRGNAFAEGKNTVLMRTNAAVNDFTGSGYTLRDTTAGADLTIVSAVGNPTGTWTSRSDYGPSVTITTLEDLIPNHNYQIIKTGETTRNVIMRGILNDYATPVKDLGATYTPAKTTFKLWIPTANGVEVLLYNKDDVPLHNNTNTGALMQSNGTSINTTVRDTPSATVTMTQVDNVWVGEYEGDIDGWYYLYKVQNKNTLALSSSGNSTFTATSANQYIIDPYAKAAVGNGRLSAVVDFAKTGTVSALSADAPVITSNVDHVVWEINVRDFSIHESSGMVNKGQYLAFTESGTTVPGTNVKTGIDHLVEMGVTTVHLLPVFDGNSINELQANLFDYDSNTTATSGKFNWGYDPINYNVPRGDYSSTPADPYSRIREFKEMVSALHEAGIRVMLDVVFNHTANTNVGTSPFAHMNSYYYRTWDNTYSSNPGFGNDVATERTMVRQYMIDSLLWWQGEYGVDGFRFDLMGCHDHETMKAIVDALKVKDPDVIVFGEPWSMNVAIPLSDSAVAGAQKDKGWGFYNDQSRNAIRGSDNRGSDRGFVEAGSGFEASIANVVKAGYATIAKASETLPYTSKHDDLVLYDNVLGSLGTGNGANQGGLTYTPRETSSGDRRGVQQPHSTIDAADPYGAAIGNNVVKATTLASGIMLTAQGVPYLHAGDEFLRSKYGNANSYNSSDAINSIRWDLKDTYMPVFDYYQGLLELRSEHPAFRMEDLAQIDDKIEILKAEDNVVAYVIGEFANGDAWKNIYVAYNGGATAKTINFGNTEDIQVVVNSKEAGVTTLETIAAGASYTLPAFGMVVAYEEHVEY